jgi:hypothetical protein
MYQLRRFIILHKTIFLSLGFLVLFSVSISYATPPATAYKPGETLDPTCAPGSTNCTVNLSGGNIVTEERFGANVSNGNVGAYLHIGNAAAFSTPANYSTSGFGIRSDANTFTSTTSTGTVSTAGINTFGIPTLAANNATTLTNAATMYIDGAPAAGANVTITNPLALEVASGTSYFGGNVGIGTTSPNSTLDLGANGILTIGIPSALHASGALEKISSNAGTEISLQSSVTSPTGRNGISFIKTNGTVDAPVAVVSGDQVGFFGFKGYDGTSAPLTALVQGYVDGAVSTGIVPIGFDFITGTTSLNRKARLTITSAGNIGIGTTVPSAGLEVSNAQTAVSAVAHGVYFDQSLTAAANNDTLVGLDISPTFNNGAFTGVTNAALRVTGDILPSSNAMYNLGGTVLNFNQVRAAALVYSGGTFQINASASNGAIQLKTNSVTNVQLFSTGNVVVQNGGTFTDAGYGLDVQNVATNGYLRAGTNALVVNASGNVGIGTNAPGTKLEVGGTLRVTGGGMQLDNNQTISAKNTSGTYTPILFGGGDNQLYMGDYIGSFTGTKFIAGNGTITFATGTSGGTSRMTIGSNGNVGIGTTAPSTALQLGSTTGNNFITLAGGTTGASYGIDWAFNTPGVNKYAQVMFDYDARATRGLQLNTLSGYGFSFNTMSNTGVFANNVMTISGSGNVGIGTASPSSVLEVFAGTTNMASGIVLNQGNSSSNTNSGRLFFSNSGDMTTNSFVIFKNTNNLAFNYGANAGTTSGTTGFVMTNGGLVGIGTTAPTHTLTLASASTGISQYNTADQTTNYERVVQAWNANTFSITSQAGGTGTIRSISLVNAIGSLVLRNTQDVTGMLYTSGNLTVAGATLNATAGTLSAASGSQSVMAINPTISQSGTAGYRALFISPFENGTGSGNKYLIDAGTNSALNGSGTHTSYFTVDDTGTVGVKGRLSVGSTSVQAAQMYVGGSFATSAPYSTSGFGFQVAPNTFTSTTSTGTIATAGINTFGIPTLAASSATTLTSAATMYIDGAPAAGTNVTISNPLALYVNLGLAGFNGGISTTNGALGATGANFYASGNQGISSSGSGNLVFGGAGTINFRSGFFGSTASTLTSNNNYTNVIVGASNVTTAATGTHALLATMVVKPLGTVTSGGATVTNTASLYVEGASSAGSTNNYAFWVASGMSQFGSSSVTTGTAVATFQNGGGTCTITPSISGAISCSSDMTLKKNITLLSDSSAWAFNSNIATDNQSVLAKVMALTPVRYNWKAESDADAKHAGFIAQEVQQLFPDLVSTDPKTHLLSLNYSGMVPYTIEAIQEMNMNIVAIDDLTQPNTWREALMNWLADSKNGIAAIFSKKVTTDELCVGATCVTEQQFLEMVQHAGTSSSTTTVSVPSDTSVPDTDTTATPPVDTASSLDTDTTPPPADDTVEQAAPVTDTTDTIAPTDTNTVDQTAPATDASDTSQ